MTAPNAKPRAGEHTPETDAEEVSMLWNDAPCWAVRSEVVRRIEASRDALAAQKRELVEALAGMIAVEDSTTQGYERELRTKWLPIARALLAKVRP